MKGEYLAMMLGMAMASGYQLPYSFRREEKDYQKCLLHGCTNQSNHNGGYCCAKHCKRHKIVTIKLRKLGFRKSGNRFIIIW